MEKPKIQKKGVTRNETEEAKNTLTTHETVDNKGEVEDNGKEEPKYIPRKPYMPPIPFPQRLAKAKLDKRFGKFLEVLKKLYINISSIEALQQMASYAKFLKDILSNKRRLKEYETVALSGECSAFIQNKLPPKLKDPGSFSILCVIRTTSFKWELCDLSASVSLMPLSCAGSW